jgi:ATP-dependent Clp protease ATP-binding subunit ClpC
MTVELIPQLVGANRRPTGQRGLFVGTEHLLLGLLRDEESTAARALAQNGVRLEEVLLGVQQIIGVGSSRSDHVPLTSRAKRVVENEFTEARRLGDEQIGTTHILLALVEEGEGVGVQTLRGLGISLREVRTSSLALVR